MYVQVNKNFRFFSNSMFLCQILFLLNGLHILRKEILSVDIYKPFSTMYLPFIYLFLHTLNPSTWQVPKDQEMRRPSLVPKRWVIDSVPLGLGKVFIVGVMFLMYSTKKVCMLFVMAWAILQDSFHTQKHSVFSHNKQCEMFVFFCP